MEYFLDSPNEALCISDYMNNNWDFEEVQLYKNTGMNFFWVELFTFFFFLDNNLYEAMPNNTYNADSEQGPLKKPKLEKKPKVSKKLSLNQNLENEPKRKANLELSCVLLPPTIEIVTKLSKKSRVCPLCKTTTTTQWRRYKTNGEMLCKLVFFFLSNKIGKSESFFLNQRHKIFLIFCQNYRLKIIGNS